MSNLIVFRLNFSFCTSCFAYISPLSWNFMLLNNTGGAPFSKAGVKSTSFGMIPRFSSVIIPLLMSSSEIGGGFCNSSCSSRNIRCRASRYYLAFTIVAIDFLALYGPFLLLLEAVGCKMPAPFAFILPSGCNILPNSSSSGYRANRACFLDMFWMAGSLKFGKS